MIYSLKRPKITTGPWLDLPTTAENAGSDRRDIVSTGGAFSPVYVAGDILPDDAKAMASVHDLMEALEPFAELCQSAGCDDMGQSDALKITVTAESLRKAKAALIKAGYTVPTTANSPQG